MDVGQITRLEDAEVAFRMCNQLLGLVANTFARIQKVGYFVIASKAKEALENRSPVSVSPCANQDLHAPSDAVKGVFQGFPNHSCTVKANA
jgi:hypothetical protein